MSSKKDKIKELIKKLSAEFLSKEADKSSIITVTDVNISNNLKNVTIFFSVYPETSESSALDFAKRKRADFKKYAKSRMQIKRIPFFDFEIDFGEKNRQKIDRLSKRPCGEAV